MGDLGFDSAFDALGKVVEWGIMKINWNGIRRNC